MRFAVLGAGMQGVACAYDLLRVAGTEVVTLYDNDANAVERGSKRLVSDKLAGAVVDCADPEALAAALCGHQVVVSALPYRLNLDAARAAVAAGAHFVDMGGHIETVLAELRLKQAAEQAGVCIIPDCGLAPGLINVMVADAVAEMHEVVDVHVRVGGLPAIPRPPWDYMLVFSWEGLINEYTGTAAVLRDWNRDEVEALAGLESIHFPEPVGDCEAAFTSGGSSTLPWTFAGRIRNLDYKTVRYPGHFEKIRALAALGLFDTRPVEIDGVPIAPRTVVGRLMQNNLVFDGDPDVVVLRVTSTGMRGGKRVTLRHEMMDSWDEETGLSAMMRTTAFSTSITACMLADGTIDLPGAFPPEKVVPPAPMFAELERRGVFIRRRWEE